MNKTKVNVSILGEIEEGEMLYSVGISSLDSGHCDIYTEFGFDSVEDAKTHVENMTQFEIIKLEVE